MRWLRTLWNWSLVVTLPVCAGYGVWAVDTWRAFSTFGVRHDPAPASYDLLQTGRERAAYLLRRIGLSFLPAAGRPAPGLRTVQLFVPESGLAALDARLPESGLSYVRGTMMVGGRSWQVSVRYRGDFVSHWGYPKKSWRVRTRRSSLFEGMRSFNLLAPKYPEQLNNHLGYLLAREMGLLAPRSELVEVVLNGRRRGLHLLVEQPDEGTLRRAGRMPGDLYSGELIARDAWRGVPPAVWDQPGLWTKAAVNNHYPEEAIAPLLALAELANGEPGAELHRRLSALLDQDAWGRFLAYETLTQCLHFDRSHNWRLYYDSNRRVFMPMVWDPVAWAPASRAFAATELDPMASRLQALLLMNGDFLRARDRALAEFYQGGGAVALVEHLDTSVALVRTAARGDPLLRPPELAAVEQAMAEFARGVRRVLDDVRAAYRSEPGELLYTASSAGGTWILDCELRGRRPLREIELVFSGLLASRLRAEVLLPGPEGGFAATPVAVAVQGAAARMRPGLVTPVGRPFRTPAQLLAPGERRGRPLSFRLRISGVGPDQRLLDVRCDRGEGMDGAVEPVAELAPAFEPWLFAAVAPQPESDYRSWQGEIELSGVVELSADLRIAAGSTVRLLPGASLRVRGRLLAEGDEKNPIRFVDSGEGPWGAVVIEGPAASGSRLRHCVFRGGSGWKEDLFEYSGMLSIHDVDDVGIEHCTFADNRRVDDVLHAVYSELRLLHCRFERAFADAVDLDICTAEISDCVFEDSGNDGIDLMTTRCTVVDSHFRHNRDKGISVGEGSRVLVLGSRFERNIIGVQVKDGSVAGIYNCDFSGNDLALDAYKKNWRYDDGGHTWIDKCRIFDNASSIRGDGNSRFYVRDSYLTDPPRPRRRYRIDDSVDARSRDRAAAGPPELPEALRSIGPAVERVWQRLRAGRRGTG